MNTPDENATPDAAGAGPAGVGETDSIAGEFAGPPAKADPIKRVVAVVIDGLIASLLCFLLPVIGVLLAIAYMLLRDGLDFEFMRHRSLGKKIMQLEVKRLDGHPMNIETSMRRNWMLALGFLSRLLMPVALLGLLLPLAALAIGVVEIVKVFSDVRGRRWGDDLAGTVVVEEFVGDPAVE